MKKSETVSVKKTLTIPKWMNEQATAAGINFSQTLQDAIRKELATYENNHQ